MQSTSAASLVSVCLLCVPIQGRDHWGCVYTAFLSSPSHVFIIQGRVPFLAMLALIQRRQDAPPNPPSISTDAQLRGKTRLAHARGFSKWPALRGVCVGGGEAKGGGSEAARQAGGKTGEPFRAQVLSTRLFSPS